MSNQLPRECQVIKLVDYMGFKYKVAVQSMGRKSKRINGPKWFRFVESYKNKNIEKLWLKKLKEVKFEISILSNEVLEVRKDASGRDNVHGCLIQAEKKHTIRRLKTATLFLYIVSFYFLEEKLLIYILNFDLSHDLLWLFSERRLKIDNLVAKVHEPKQSCKVDVCYVFPIENEKGLAVGFMGSGWTTICFENDIEENCQLLFQWMGSTPEDHFNFTVKIFNKDGIGLHVGTTHHCSCSNHRHRKRRPRYKKQFEYHVIRRHSLFLVQLLVRRDPRKADDNTHLIMYSNWQRIIDEAGMSMGKVLRFEMIEE
ncbi:hypothetical protein Hanom_Chr12g01120151 [Helianthus anomalus]